MIRIDQYLVKMGYTKSRTTAKKLIEANAVQIDGLTINRASALIDDTADHDVNITEEFKYVSRGG